MGDKNWQKLCSPNRRAGRKGTVYFPFGLCIVVRWKRLRDATVQIQLGWGPLLQSSSLQIDPSWVET